MKLFGTIAGILALSATALADPAPPARLDVSCYVTHKGQSVETLYVSSEGKPISMLIGSMSSDVLLLDVGGSGDSVDVRVQGRDNFTATAGENLTSVRDGLNGSAAGTIDVDPTKKNPVRHVNFDVEVSNAKSLVHVACSAVSHSPRAAAIAAANAAKSHLGVSLVSFTN
ncbi:MAG: hypothetical protein HY075_05880 [Deltaproteobacteria bacterium]|nr:hypothetical protein [Deltaproteobacteria bacterium]